MPSVFARLCQHCGDEMSENGRCGFESSIVILLNSLCLSLNNSSKAGLKLSDSERSCTTPHLQVLKCLTSALHVCFDLFQIRRMSL